MNDALLGCLLGTAVGDSMGLPFEGMSQRKIASRFPRIDRHRWCFGVGMVSDDTEHTWIVLEALQRWGADVREFERLLAKGLRIWFLTLPSALGWATLRACLKLCLGFSPRHSGVFSAGHGPAMRSAIIGVWFRHDVPRLESFVRASTRITHTDPKAEHGARAVAFAAAGLGCPYTEVVAAPPAGDGVSGYIYDTVSAALYLAEQYHGDFRGAVAAAIRCGGDTDTVAAITGAIVGSHVGEAGIPPEWIDGIRDWPRSVPSMRKLASEERVHLPFLGMLARNIVFFVIAIVGTILRQCLPATSSTGLDTPPGP